MINDVCGGLDSGGGDEAWTARLLWQQHLVLDWCIVIICMILLGCTIPTTMPKSNEKTGHAREDATVYANHKRAVRLPLIDRATRLSAGAEHVCAILSDHTVWCSNRVTMSSIEAGEIPERVYNLQNVRDVFSGEFRACAVLEDGTLWCWNNGLVDDANRITRYTYTDRIPIRVRELDTVHRVATGEDHTCVVLRDATAWCWGLGFDGKLGIGSEAVILPHASGETREGPVHTFVPRQVRGLGAVDQISAGASHTCARLKNGEVWCWGNNKWGQLGDGTNNQALVPVKITGVNDAAQVVAGMYHTCVLLSAGEVWCWGE